MVRVIEFDDTETGTQQLVAKLVRELSSTLVAEFAGVPNSTVVISWLDGSDRPSSQQLEKLHFADDVFSQLASAESPDVAQAWFIGASVDVGMADIVSPCEAIRDGYFSQVRYSAIKLARDDWL